MRMSDFQTPSQVDFRARRVISSTRWVASMIPSTRIWLGKCAVTKMARIASSGGDNPALCEQAGCDLPCCITIATLDPRPGPETHLWGRLRGKDTSPRIRGDGIPKPGKSNEKMLELVRQRLRNKIAFLVRFSWCNWRDFVFISFVTRRSLLS